MSTVKKYKIFRSSHNTTPIYLSVYGTMSFQPVQDEFDTEQEAIDFLNVMGTKMGPINDFIILPIYSCKDETEITN